MLAYALLLSREYAPAAEVLRRLYDSGSEADNEGLPVLLAWSYLETGREKDAVPLLAFNPVPPVTGPGLFTAFLLSPHFRSAGPAGGKAGADGWRRDQYQAVYRALRQRRAVAAPRVTGITRWWPARRPRPP